MIEVHNLSVRFGDFYAVRDISFTVGAGEIFGFLGANGAGKTTTIRVLCGLLTPTNGRVFVEGESVETGIDALKSKVGYMSQKFTLYDDLTVEENLAFTASLRKLPRVRYLKRRKEILDFIAFDRALDTLVRDLPGGIKQQVSLAAAVLHDPKVVFLDEPTAGVTPVARALFWDLIRSLASAGKTVFVTTHYMDEAEQSGRIALMRAGEIIALDTPEHLKHDTFPHGVYELMPHGKVPEATLEWIQTHRDGFVIQPHGRRYHVLVQDNSAWEQARPKLAPDFEMHRIPPSLEDVFIELVEGKNR